MNRWDAHRWAWIVVTFSLFACSDDDSEVDSSTSLGGPNTNAASVAGGVGIGAIGGHSEHTNHAGTGALGWAGSVGARGGSAGGGYSAPGGNAGVGGTGVDTVQAGVAGVPLAGGGAACSGQTACDDGNPCTSDCQGPSGCEHLALDGVACNDGLLCTSSARCVKGACVGSSSDDSLVSAATRWAYGGSGFSISAFLSEDRLAIAENTFKGALLSLVRIKPDRLELESQTVIDSFPLYQRSVSDWIWAKRPVAHLVPLGGGRVALVAGSATAGDRIDLFQVASGQWERLSSNSFGAAIPDDFGPDAAVGRGDTIWVCPGIGAGSVRKHAIRPDGTVDILKGETIPIPGLGSCRGLALAEGGNSLFVAGDGLIAELDLSNPSGTPAVRQSLAVPGRALLDLQTSPDYVVFRGVVPVSTGGPTGLGDVVVLSAADFTHTVAQYPMEGPRGTVLSFTLLETDLLLEEDPQADDCQTEVRLIELATNQTKGSQRMDNASCLTPPEVVQLAVPKAFGKSMIDLSQSEVVRINTEEFALTPLTGPEHGGLQHVFATGTQRATALGLRSAHELDLTGPSPRFTSGGRIMAAHSQQQLVLPAAKLVENQCPYPSESSLASRLISLTWLGEQSTPSVRGSLKLEGAAAASREALYGVIRDTGARFKLRRYPLAQLTSDGAQTPTADLESVFELDGVTGSELSRTDGAYQIDVDRDGHAIVMASSWMDSAKHAVLKVAWLTPKDNGSLELQTATAAASALVQSPNDIAIVGTKALLVTWDTLWLSEHKPNSSTLVPAVRAAQTIPGVKKFWRLLGFDGETAVVAADWQTDPSATRYTTGVLAFRVADGALVGSYPTDERITSLAEVDGRWLLGACNSVTALAPACHVTSLTGTGGQSGAGGAGGAAGAGAAGAAGAAGSSGAAGGPSPVFPWIGSLTGTDGKALCAGALISERWWLTAAQCVRGRDAPTLSVGLSSVTNQRRSLARIVEHPNYDATTRSHDLALVELSSNVDSDGAVCPTTLETPAALLGDIVSLIGPGGLDVGSQSAPIAASACTVQNGQFCVNVYDRSALAPGQFCLENSANGGDCHANLGGTAASRATSDAPWKQVGVVSWAGPECKQAVVTPLLAADLAWIQTTAGPLHVLGDVDGDHAVTINDVEQVITRIDTTKLDCRADVNHDGTVTTADYEIVMNCFLTNNP